MKTIEIYTTPICGYCRMAKRLLEDKGAAYVEIDVMSDQSKRAEMTRRATGGRTVPQIFIDGIHVGGCDDLYALERRGELDRMLAA
ncbi:MAG: glutaredoxin 3 [Paracoccaceae bacterium]